MQNSRKPDLNLRLTRRLFISEMATASVALSALPAVFSGVMLPSDGHSPLTDARSAGVVSIHMNQTYWDESGAAIPYFPPRGTRSAAPIAHLSEQAFRSMHCYV
jgi:hypothetical protein